MTSTSVQIRTLAPKLFSPVTIVFGGVFYLITAARTVQFGDSGELTAIGAAGGVPHPSGYPLFILWLRALTLLPAASPAHRAALATAILGGLTLATLGWAARAWGATRSSAAIAVSLYAFSPLTWRLATEPEVFALNTLIASTILALSSQNTPLPIQREEVRVGLLGLVAGLGLSNHHTIVLLMPVGLYCAFRSLWRSSNRLGAAALGLAGLVCGLLPYLYLVEESRSATSACVWGNLDSLHAVARHFLRAEYGSMSLAASTSAQTPSEQLSLLGETLVRSLLWIPLLIVLGCRFVGTRGAETEAPPPEPSTETRGAWIALVGSFVLAGPVFVAVFNIPPHGLGRLIVERFHLLPLMIAAVLVAAALGRALRALRSSAAQAALGSLGVLAIARMILQDVVPTHEPTLERYLTNVLRFVPSKSVIITTADDTIGGFMYAKCALGVRPDVDVVTPRLLGTDWYPSRVVATVGIDPSFAKNPSAEGLLSTSLRTARPVFVTEWFAPGLEQRFASYPIGPLIRVVSDPAAVPAPHALFEQNNALFDSMDLLPPDRAATFAANRYRDYVRPWSILANALEREADGQNAALCRERIASLQPKAR